MKFRELKLRKNPNCPMCGEHRTINKLIDYYEFCGVRGEELRANLQVPEITPRELKARLDRGDDLFILDVREPHEFQIAISWTPDSAWRTPAPRARDGLFARNRCALPQRQTLAEAVDFLRKADSARF